jgi:hypothetical protein
MCVYGWICGLHEKVRCQLNKQRCESMDEFCGLHKSSEQAKMYDVCRYMYEFVSFTTRHLSFYLWASQVVCMDGFVGSTKMLTFVVSKQRCVCMDGFVDSTMLSFWWASNDMWVCVCGRDTWGGEGSKGSTKIVGILYWRCTMNL